MYNFSTSIGPGSDSLPRNELNSRSLVDRGGEITTNAFIDSTVWNIVLRRSDKRGDAYIPDKAALDPENGLTNTPIKNEHLCPFNEWATTQPGFICVNRLDSSHYSRKIEAETAIPVISCCQMLFDKDERAFKFAGIARSPCIIDYDDLKNGMKHDDHFTLAIGGKFTLLNNGDGPIHLGDLVEWYFLPSNDTFNAYTAAAQKKQKTGPRRILVRKATDSHRQVFGRALSSARKDQNFDVLLMT